jgi:uncharacterized protein YciI
MQFFVTAYDGADADASARRQAARPEHIRLGDELVAKKQMLFGVAILDDAGAMIGSALVVDFPTRAALDEWLRVEPYVMGKVWERIEVRPCRVGPSFVGVHS